MVPTRPSDIPGWRQQLQAVALAVACAVALLGRAWLPSNALVPFAPELLDVHAAEAHARGAADALAAVRGNLAMGDGYTQSLCWYRVLQTRWQAGESPLWTRDIGGGANFAAQMAQGFHPVALLPWLSSATHTAALAFGLHQVLFGWLAYRFLRRLGCQHASALFGLVAATLGLWLQAHLHHPGVLAAGVPVFAMLWAVLAIHEGGGARAIAGLALATGCAWLGGFPGVALQASYLAAAFAIVAPVRDPVGSRARRIVACAAGLLLGSLVATAQIAPVLDALACTSRPEFAPALLQAHGLEWDHLWTALWPDLLCWAQDHIYRQPTPEFMFEDPARMPWAQIALLSNRPSARGAVDVSWVETGFAIGLSGCLFAVVGATALGRLRGAAFFTATTALGFGLATADEPFLTLLRCLPGLGTGDTRRCLFTASIGLTALAGLGAEHWLRGGWRRALPRVTATLAVVLGGLAIAVQAMGSDALLEVVAWLVSLDPTHPAVAGAEPGELVERLRAAAKPEEAAVNLAALRNTAWRAAAVGVAAALLLRSRHRVPALLAIALVNGWELWHVGHSAVQVVAAERVTRPPTILAPVLASSQREERPRLHRIGRTDDWRVFALCPPNLPGFWGIEDVACYQPLPPRRLEDLHLAIEPDRPGKPSAVYHGAGVMWPRLAESATHPLLDVLGVRFLLVDGRLSDATLRDCTPPGVGERFRLYERTTALPRATFHTDVVLCPDRDARLHRLQDRSHDPRRRLILEDPRAPSVRASATTDAAVTLRSHRDESVVVDVHTAVAGYLRLADPTDSGWRATIDGNATPLYVADHALRAVFVPPGQHRIEFSYSMPHVRYPAWVSLVAVALVLGLATARRRRAALT